MGRRGAKAQTGLIVAIVGSIVIVTGAAIGVAKLVMSDDIKNETVAEANTEELTETEMSASDEAMNIEDAEEVVTEDTDAEIVEDAEAAETEQAETSDMDFENQEINQVIDDADAAKSEVEMPVKDVAAESAEANVSEVEPVEMVATDKARIRKAPNTDGEILGNASIGDKFTKTGDAADGWSRVKYKNGEAYIKSDYLKKYSEEEAAAEAAASAETANTETAANTEAANGAASAETANAEAEQQQSAPAAAEPVKVQPAPAPAPSGSHTVYTSDGITMNVNDAQYNVFKKYWGYLGDLDEVVSHHTQSDLITLLQNEGVWN